MASNTKRRRDRKSRRSSKNTRLADGCDLKIRKSEATPDEDLPAAKGGVA